MKYYIAIEERRSIVVEVEAESVEKATYIAQQAYDAEQIILDKDTIDDDTQFFDETDRWKESIEDGYETYFPKISGEPPMVQEVRSEATSQPSAKIQLKEDDIIHLVKTVIHGNSTFQENTETVILDSNDIDHLAEEVAKLVASGSPAPIPSKPQFRQCFELTENCKKPQTMFRRFEKKYPKAWEVWGGLFEYMLANELDSMGEKGWQLWLQTDEEARTHYMSIVLTDPQQRIV